MAKNEIEPFRKIVWAHYKKFGRHDLPWRKTHNPYKILVSEVMLQQTRVERVVPFYKKFIRQFPTADRLASAPLASVLRSWQGLGYNRRAKMLREAAQALARLNLDARSQRFNPVAELEKLPGVGPYTANAIRAFSYNENVIVIETNIRTVVMHHFFSTAPEQKGMIYHTGTRKVCDKEIEGILEKALPKGRAKEWYSALMDYGAYLKKSGVRVNAKHANYVKQKKFSGSLREARGAILRELINTSCRSTHLVTLLGPLRRAQLRAALRALETEGLIRKDNSVFSLPE